MSQPFLFWRSNLKKCPINCINPFILQEHSKRWHNNRLNDFSYTPEGHFSSSSSSASKEGHQHIVKKRENFKLFISANKTYYIYIDMYNIYMFILYVHVVKQLWWWKLLPKWWWLYSAVVIYSFNWMDKLNCDEHLLNWSSSLDFNGNWTFMDFFVTMVIQLWQRFSTY